MDPPIPDPMGLPVPDGLELVPTINVEALYADKFASNWSGTGMISVSSAVALTSP